METRAQLGFHGFSITIWKKKYKAKINKNKFKMESISKLPCGYDYSPHFRNTEVKESVDNTVRKMIFFIVVRFISTNINIFYKPKK
jgi:hypothetical protein